jgi:SAM-dependent methyltransferase
MNTSLYHDSAESIDWNEVWQERRRRNRESREESGEDRRWEKPEQARRYAEEADTSYQRRVNETLELLPLFPGARVLDIGSGPGTLTIPMARIVTEVIAVEPAEGMGRLLLERAAHAGLANIRWVAKRWEDVIPDTDLDPPYDIVLASFSLGMDDLRSALRKMDRISSGWVFLFSFADMPLRERMCVEIWQDLHGRKYLPSPKIDVVWNLLHQEGILANVAIRPLEKTYRFGDMEPATSFFARRFGASGPAGSAILRDYLTGVNQASDGTFLLQKMTAYAAVWWEKEGKMRF